MKLCQETLDGEVEDTAGESNPITRKIMVETSHLFIAFPARACPCWVAWVALQTCLFINKVRPNIEHPKFSASCSILQWRWNRPPCGCFAGDGHIDRKYRHSSSAFFEKLKKLRNSESCLVSCHKWKEGQLHSSDPVVWSGDVDWIFGTYT